MAAIAGLRRPRAGTIRFAPGGDYALEFDGGKWGARAGEGDGSVVVQTRPEALAAFVMGPLDGRVLPWHDIQVEGREPALRELRAVFGAGAAT